MFLFLLLKRLTHCALSALFVLAMVVQIASAAPVIPNPPPPITGTVTLWYSYATGSGEETALMQVIANALVDNPGLVITATQVPYGQIYGQYQSAVEGGGGPDLLIYNNDSLGDMVRNDLIQNLETALTGRLDHVYPAAVQGMQYEGQLYGVPESAKAVALFYNNSTIAVPPTTTAELQALVAGGKELVIANGSGGGAYYHFGFFTGFGGDLLDAEGRCIADRAGFKPAMQYLVALRDAGAAVISDYYNQGALQFHDGAIDMLIDGVWNLAWYKDGLGSNLGLVMLPDGPAGNSAPLNGIDGFFVNPNTTNFTSAVELALYMTSQASSQLFTDSGGHVPVRDDITSSDPLINTFAQASMQGYPRPQVEEFNSYWGSFGEMMTDVLAGTITWQMGVQRACDSMNELNGFDVYKGYLPSLMR
jgi:arabinogalactan oligomer/maltooligosaccharide transport system substrate-binding protein